MVFRSTLCTIRVDTLRIRKYECMNFVPTFLLPLPPWEPAPPSLLRNPTLTPEKPNPPRHRLKLSLTLRRRSTLPPGSRRSSPASAPAPPTTPPRRCHPRLSGGSFLLPLRQSTWRSCFWGDTAAAALRRENPSVIRKVALNWTRISGSRSSSRVDTRWGRVIPGMFAPPLFKRVSLKSIKLLSKSYPSPRWEN